MVDAADVAVTLVWGGLLAVYIAQARSSAKARARQRAGIAHQACARCGEGLPATLIEGHRSMCDSCLSITRRNYRAGFWFFGALAGFFAVMVPIVIVVEHRRFGSSPAIQDFLVIVVMITLTGGASWGLHRAGKRLE